jgi:hypothetical protein
VTHLGRDPRKPLQVPRWRPERCALPSMGQLSMIKCIRQRGSADHWAAPCRLTYRASVINVEYAQERPPEPSLGVQLAFRGHEGGSTPLWDPVGTGRAIIALARKFLGIIYHTLKNNWVFEVFPNFVLAEVETQQPLLLSWSR